LLSPASKARTLVRARRLIAIAWEWLGIALMVAAVLLLPTSVIVLLSSVGGASRSSHWPVLMLLGCACLLLSWGVRREVRHRRGIARDHTITPLRWRGAREP
jgi:hypothetical protein